MPGLKRTHTTMEMLEKHTSKATSSRWKGFIIKSYNKQWNNDMEPHAAWATRIWEQNDCLWSHCSSVCRTTKTKVHRATVLPGGACSPGSHLLFLPISGAQQRLRHTASHTYAKYCWTPRTREQNSIKTDGKAVGTCFICNTWLFPHSTEL